MQVFFVLFAQNESALKILHSLFSCDSTASVTAGFCESGCSNVYIYMVLLAIIKLVVSFSAVGNLIIDLR